MKRREGTTHDWMILVVLTVLTVYFYIFMEWLFFVTKPSFMSSLGFVDRMLVLWVTPVPFVVSGAAALFLCWVPAAVLRRRIVRTICLAVGLLLPAAILALTLFLLIDNFTYTVFRFGVISTIGYQGLVYGLLVLILIAFSYQFLHDLKKKLSASVLYRGLGFAALGLFTVSLVFAVAAHDPADSVSVTGDIDIGSMKDRPNVILLAGDGLNAESMSVYGYGRDTTPFIGGLARGALLCENCFTNAGCSGASIASMFTGKLPTETRLVYPPDILKGRDRYRHLPGLFRELGYRTIDFSLKHYADPYDLNLRKSFDWSNFREIKAVDNVVTERMGSLFGQEPDYFVFVMNDRITSRLLHSFSVRTMKNAYLEVTERGKKKYVEYKEGEEEYNPIVTLFSFIDASPAPFFAHLHLLDTHGPTFELDKQWYSAGKRQSISWMRDFYDDAILGFDGKVKEIVRGLESRGILDNTVIVICTDHAQRFTARERIPLMFVFPNGEHAGRIRANVQNLDIGPTILDHMGIEQPAWMGGLSLLSPEAESTRFIYTVDRKHGDEARGRDGLELDQSTIGPPFYTLGSVGVFYCDRLFNLMLEEHVLTVFRIEGHTAPCSEGDAPDPQSVVRLIIEHLAGNGYDTSSLETSVTVRMAE
jgi:arylsulfatase A-like enzyme